MATSQPLNLINFGGTSGVTAITILGADANNTIIDAQNTGHIFDNFGATAETAITITFQGITITRGSATTASGFPNAAAIYVETNATALLQSVIVSSNIAQGGAGAIDMRGIASINNSTFSGNSAAGEGGVIRSTGSSPSPTAPSAATPRPTAGRSTTPASHRATRCPSPTARSPGTAQPGTAARSRRTPAPPAWVA